MDKSRFPTIANRATRSVRAAIVAIVFIVLFSGIISFVLKWSVIAVHPNSILLDYRPITEDIFSILVVYELLDLLRTLSPTRLMDVILLVLARKLVLAPDESYLLGEIFSFAILLLVRLLWNRFSNKRTEAI